MYVEGQLCVASSKVSQDYSLFFFFFKNNHIFKEIGPWFLNYQGNIPIQVFLAVSNIYNTYKPNTVYFIISPTVVVPMCLQNEIYIWDINIFIFSSLQLGYYIDISI